MKHIKKFETYQVTFHDKIKTPNFKVGDCVICINPITDSMNADGNLELHQKYYITSITKNSIGEYHCTVKNKYTKFYCHRFLIELEFYTNQYNI